MQPSGSLVRSQMKLTSSLAAKHSPCLLPASSETLMMCVQSHVHLRNAGMDSTLCSYSLQHWPAADPVS